MRARSSDASTAYLRSDTPPELAATFLDLILAQQIADIEQGKPATNCVAIERLSRRDRNRLRAALKTVEHVDELTRATF